MRGIAAGHPEAAREELWFEDEARVGQKGRTTHVWHQKGVRPRGVREHRFASAHLFGAVCPERDAGVALVLPEVSTAAMNLFLAELARAVPEDAHAVVVLDRAGWHVSAGLAVPTSLTLVHLPPYSPELNPAERLFEEIRRHVEGRVYATLDAKVAEVQSFLEELDADPPRVRRLCGWDRINTTIAALPGSLANAA